LTARSGFSALQRAEIAEICRSDGVGDGGVPGFSALQRAEIAEIAVLVWDEVQVSRFSALQRAEIAEIFFRNNRILMISTFQCSSTSRNC